MSNPIKDLEHSASYEAEMSECVMLAIGSFSIYVEEPGSVFGCVVCARFTRVR